MAFIAGVGKANLDLIYSGMPRVPHEGEEIYATGFDLLMGGGVSATLINLGRLGISTTIATYLGTDMFSQFVRNQFDQNGVSPINLYHGSGIPLNISSVVLTPQDRTFISYGEDIPMTDALLDQAYQAMRGAKVIPMQADMLEVYRQLHREGTLLVLDMGWDDAMSIEKYKDYLEVADYFTPNTKEALKITGEATPQAAAQRLGAYFEKVIVKLDKDGCLVAENGKQFVIENIQEFQHMDSTGAGDAFLSGFLYGLYQGSSFREAVLYGNITGGKCVTRIGCLTAYVNETQLLDYAQKYRRLLEDT